MDAAILHRLDGAGDLDDAARGLVGVGIGGARRASCGYFHVTGDDVIASALVVDHRAAEAARPAFRLSLNISRTHRGGRWYLRDEYAIET
jgi:hypothetical protein